MKSLGVLWLVVFISLAGFGITTIPFPLVAESMGASDFWKTFGGAGVFSLFQFIATPIWGRCSDAYGRKPILLFSLIGSVVAYFWLAYATDLISLLLSRAFGGVMSGNLGAAFAYASDVTDPKDRAKGLGIIASAFAVGFAVGPLIGGILGTIGGGAPNLHWPGIVSALLAVIASLGTIFFLPESLPVALRKPFGLKAEASSGPKSSHLLSLFSKPLLVGLLVASLLVSIGGGALQSVFQFWGRDLFNFTLKDLGLQFMLLAVLSAVGQAGLIGPLTKRFGEKPVVLAAVIGVTFSLVIFAVAQQAWLAWFAMGLFGVSNGLFFPAASSLVSFQAAPNSRGMILGLYNASGSAGRIIGPALSGPIYFSFGPGVPFALAAVLSAFAVVLLARVQSVKHA